MYTSKWIKKKLQVPPQWRTVCDDHCTYTSDAMLSWNGLHTMSFVCSVASCWHFKSFTQITVVWQTKALFFSAQFTRSRRERSAAAVVIRVVKGLTRNPFCSLQNIKVTQVALFTDDIIIIFLVSEKSSQLSLSSSLLGDKL